MEFEDVLKEVGDYGRYQKRLLYLLLVPLSICLPFLSMSTLFMVAAPDHWCYVPELANLSHVVQHRLIRPPDSSVSSGLSQCLMYDIDYLEVAKNGNESAVYRNVSALPTKKCDNGWLFDDTFYDETAVTKHNLVCDKRHFASLILSMGWVGNIIGNPIFGWISDRFSRKKSFTIAILTSLLSMISPNFIQELNTFIVFRLLGKLSYHSIVQAPYIVVTELVGPKFRTAIAGIEFFTWTIGLCLLPLLAYLTRHWVYLNWFTSVLNILIIGYVVMLPESPRWLISRREFKKAVDLLKEVAKTNNKPEPQNLEAKLIAVEKTISKKQTKVSEVSVLEFIRRPRLGWIFLLATYNWTANAVAYDGIHYNIYNFHGNEFINFFLLAVVEFPSYLAAWYLMDTKLGRRWSNAFFSLICGLSLWIPAMLPQNWKICSNLAILVAKFATSSASLPMYQQQSELFPTPLRSQGMALTTMLCGLANLGVPYIPLLATFGLWIPLAIIGTVALSAGVEATFLPETLNENLPQTIEDGENFGRGRKYWRFARTKPRKEDKNDASDMPLNSID